MIRSVLLTVIVTLALFTVVLYTGCVKTDSTTDKCANITCQHGGSCTNGVCYCPSQYTGTYCEKRTCEVQNTARIRFINKSTSSKTYSVVWDGSTLLTLAPGVTSEYYTVQAGSHTLHFMISNGGEACTQSTPVLTVCYDHEYWCDK